jgi:hypothetical protein
VHTVLDSGLDVFAQNLETVRRLTHPVRDPRRLRTNHRRAARGEGASAAGADEDEIDAVRDLVVALEDAVIAYVAELGVAAEGSRANPGVYVEGAKLASVGLRIRRGASYHGLALNVCVDLQPFERINVCGHRGLKVARLSDHVARFVGNDAAGVAAMDTVAKGLTPHLLRLNIETDYSAISTDLQAVNSR